MLHKMFMSLSNRLRTLERNRTGSAVCATLWSAVCAGRGRSFHSRQGEAASRTFPLHLDPGGVWVTVQNTQVF